MGKISWFQARLHVNSGTTPKAYKARCVAFSLWEPVERELQKKVNESLLERVDQSEWATPIVVVPKSDGAVRIYGDYRATINKDLVIDEYPLPTIDELFSTMAGGDKFSKIDLAKAYLQLEVHSDDRRFLTLATPKGLFQPTRLMFGVACAPAIWQRWMEQLLSDIPGVSVFLDDIKVTAPDDSTHLHRIGEVLGRLDAHNMRYEIQVKRSSENMNADAMSRLPNREAHPYMEEVYLIEAEAISNLPVTLPDLQKATANDKRVEKLMQCLKYGRTSEAADRFGIQQTEFSLHEGCLLRGIR
ncbi:PREDICTED: uncharacterized protein K02A2.6-like, partial [Rhagoletis zephyria]|uniref:uncharacterized protein K02A2.6-like n=1 Tax=Rhagoletis zephyria TaxID=28612 RepID=UPI0008112133